MIPFRLGMYSKRPLTLLCLGAHSDDLEIGCAGTVLELLRRYPRVHLHWVVLSAAGARAAEARRSARALARGAAAIQIIVGNHTDGHFPAEFGPLKSRFEDFKRSIAPDLILTHHLRDRHQDHRIVAELTWQTWRDHLILEYEIPKYEGDLGQPNVYVPLSPQIATRKVRHLMRHFGTQRSRSWFHPTTFEALMRLRAVECRSASGFAEAFHLQKATITV